MNKTADQFWKRMKKRKDFDIFTDRLKSEMAKAPEAITYLKKVTGKVGIHRIRPFKEKRWSEKCMESWMVLSAILIMIEEGITPEEWQEEFFKSYKPMGSNFIGRHKVAEWKAGSGDTHIIDKITLKQPDLSENWKPISASEADKLMRKKK